MSPPSVVRGLAALGAGVAVVLAGGGLALGLGAANPPPDRVLRDARRALASARSLHFDAVVTTTGPVGADGTRQVRTRTVTGEEAFPHGWDYRITEGTNAAEYLSTRATGGLLARGGVAGAPLQAVTWTRYAGFAELDRGMPPAALLADDLSNIGNVRAWLTAASDPQRAAGHREARHVVVNLDPSIAFADQGGLVSSASAELNTDGDGRLSAMTITIAEAGTTLTDHITFTRWNQPVVIAAPAPADVVASPSAPATP